MYQLILQNDIHIILLTEITKNAKNFVFCFNKIFFFKTGKKSWSFGTLQNSRA